MIELLHTLKPDLDFWEGLLVAMLVAGIVLVWMASRNPDNKYNFRDVMSDEITGKASFRKLAGLVALIATTWVFLRMTVYNKLPEWFGQFYFVTWALVLMVPKLADKLADIVAAIITRQVPAPPPPTPPPTETPPQ